MPSNSQIHTNVCTDVLFLGAEPRIFKAPKALFIGAEPRIFKVPPEAPLKISSEVRRRRGEREIFRGASGGTSNNSGRSPSSRRGSAKIQKFPKFPPIPKATIGANETPRFQVNSASVFVELFSKIHLSKNPLQIRTISSVSGVAP